MVALLSLPDDALLRVFFYLASPPQNDDLLLSPCSSSPLLLNNPDSPAATLGQTSYRLHVLYHRAVCLVDVRRAPCACGAPPSLQAFPSADAVVLNQRHVTLDACTDAASLGRLRVLGVRCLPGEVHADQLTEAMPNLRELLLGFRKYGPYSMHNIEYLRELQRDRGMQSFVLRLPPALRRLSLLGGFGRVQLDGFWDSVSRLEELEELNVSLDFEVASIDSMAPIRRCRRLRRFSVGREIFHLGVDDFISIFPPSLAHFLVFHTNLDLGVADLFRPDMRQSKIEEEAHQGLETLRIIGNTFFRHFAVLQPVASQLLKLHIATTSAQSFWTVVPVPYFPRLEELRLEVGSEIICGFNSDTLKQMLTSAPVLRMLSLTLRAKPTFTGKSLAAALSSATSSLSLRCLNLHLAAHLRLPKQFERVAPAIGNHFSEIQELDLKNTIVTPACLNIIGQKFPLLSSLKLGSGKPRVEEAPIYAADDRSKTTPSGAGASAAMVERIATVALSPALAGDVGLETKVEHMAAEIGSHFQRITVLDLSDSDISSRGLEVIGRFCLLVKYISLAWCAQIDDTEDSK